MEQHDKDILMEKVNSTMIYYNFYKCHNVHPVQQKSKKTY
jgi:uncharacterized ParB-like nuclease family protein